LEKLQEGTRNFYEKTFATEGQNRFIHTKAWRQGLTFQAEQR